LENETKQFNIDVLLQETLALTEFIGLQNAKSGNEELIKNDDTDYLFDLADSIFGPSHNSKLNISEDFLSRFPENPGVIYRIDDSGNTFCVRGFSASNIRKGIIDLLDLNSSKRPILKLNDEIPVESLHFFVTKNLELAESVREQIINRRFPKMEDSVCNISDPGFSWWMDVSLSEGQGRFEIFFKAHSVNRAEKYIQLGPIGDGAIAGLRLNQARTLLRSSFPVTEYVCTDRSALVVTSKPDHLSFISFKNIFLLGENQTTEESFPDNSLGRTLFYYFHELATIRKFWIEVQKHLR
jgi:hypothetical protein